MSRQVQRRRRETPASNWDLFGPAAVAVAQLSKQEIDLPERPEERAPRLPEDPTDLTDAALMELFVKMTNWSSYTDSMLAVAEVNESSAEADVKRLEALSAAANAGQKNVTTAKAKAYEDPEYIDAKNAMTEAYAFRKIASALHDQAEKRATLLSRELTRRVGREPRESRAGRWSA